jgi:hypothetical protein
MNPRSQGIFVACTVSALFVQVIGRGACRNSESLRKFGQTRLNEGCQNIYVDLLRCDGLDSTFLGIFAGFGLALRSKGALLLVNLAGENLKAFQALGLDHFDSIHVVAEHEVRPLFPDQSDFQLLAGSDLNATRSFDALERALIMLECHEDLCRLDERNEEKFREVKRFLREDIVRHTSPNGQLPPHLRP